MSLAPAGLRYGCGYMARWALNHCGISIGLHWGRSFGNGRESERKGTVLCGFCAAT